MDSSGMTGQAWHRKACSASVCRGLAWPQRSGATTRAPGRRRRFWQGSDGIGRRGLHWRAVRACAGAWHGVAGKARPGVGLQRSGMSSYSSAGKAREAPAPQAMARPARSGLLGPRTVWNATDCPGEERRGVARPVRIGMHALALALRGAAGGTQWRAQQRLAMARPVRRARACSGMYALALAAWGCAARGRQGARRMCPAVRGKHWRAEAVMCRERPARMGNRCQVKGSQGVAGWQSSRESELRGATRGVDR